MTAAVINFTVDKLAGRGFQKTFYWKTGRPPLPVPFVGATARLHARANRDTDPLLLDLTTENGGVVLGETDGSARIVLTPEQVAAITWQTAKYALAIFFADGTSWLQKGTITVVPEF